MANEAPSRRATVNFWRGRSSARDDAAALGERLRPLWWAVAYVVITTLAYAPTLTFRAVPARPGEIATRDVVAPRDLVVFDAEATERRRAEAAAGVLPVYDWVKDAPTRLERELHDSFERARQAASRAKPKGRVTDEVRAAFTLPIGDEALGALAEPGFSPAAEDRLVALTNEIYLGGVVDNRELLQEQRSHGIVLRDAETGRENRRKDLAGAVEFGGDTKTTVAARLGDSLFTGRSRSEVAAFLAAALRPNMTFNAAETARRRDEAGRSVESVFARLPRGKVVVRRGDEITGRTASWIAAARASASDPASWVHVFGVFVLQVLAAAVFWFDARRQRRRKRERSPYVTYGSVLATGIVFALVTRGAFLLMQTLSSSVEGSTSAALNYAIPFAAGPIVASLVAGMGPALLAVLVNAVGAGVLMGQSFGFMLVAAVGALAGIFGLGRLRARSVLLGMGATVAAANVVTIAANRFISPESSGFSILPDLAGGVAGGIVVGAVVGLFLPLFEQLFHVVTDIRLLELSNQNLPLLRQLALEAPGTYQHSLMLGHLAEAAADAIDADSILARVSGYYHDIGKTKMPDYFIENQPKGLNRHDRLEPSMSALIIAAHVKEGIEMAKKARLPEPILTGIREHHGTKLIRFFYQKALSKAEPDSGTVRETDYRYPGPKPSTRILGILMIADAVEAASRTLTEPTPAKIRAMIQTIVDDCLRDGQLDDCDLTMRDLAVIIDALERTVARMYHHRIDYPGFDFNSPPPKTPDAASPAARADRRATGPRAVN